jgi:hypothetical protein
MEEDMAGRPKGSRNKHSCKPFRDALRIELAAAGEDQKALREVAKKLIRKAQGGDMAAIREIADRVDGKNAQSLEMSGELTLTYEDALAQLRR